MIAGSSLFSPMIYIKNVVLMSLWPRTIRIVISNWPRTLKFSQFFKNTGGEGLFLLWSRVGQALRPIFMLWWVKMSDWWVRAENSCGILKIVYFGSWSWQSFVSTCDVFNCLFPLDVQMKYSCYQEFSVYSWLVCVLGFWLRNASLVKFGNSISDGNVFVFHLA